MSDEYPPDPEITVRGSRPEPPGVPGVPRAGFDRLPTAALPAQSATVPAESSAPLPLPQWMTPPPPTAPHRGVAAWAMVLAIAALAASFLVGWGFPVGVAAIVVAGVALRRPMESRATAGWALALGIVSVLYSAGWLLWAATRMNLFG